MTVTDPVLDAVSAAGVASAQQAGTVGVLTWNVQHASPERALRQAAWLAGQPEADIITLTEVSAGTAGERLAEALTGHGYTTHLTDSGGADYRVLLGTRIGRLQPVPAVHVGYLPHRLAAASITLPDRPPLGLVGLYVPSRGPRDQRNVAKRAFQTAVATVLPTLPAAFGPEAPVLVAGDLNVVEPGHQPHHAVFGAWEYDFYRAFAAAGLADAYRHHHPNTVDHSWYGRSGAGYRFDHLFCTSPHLTRLSSCGYLHHPRRSGLSDHAALAAHLFTPVP
jgi:exonuclease III